MVHKVKKKKTEGRVRMFQIVETANVGRQQIFGPPAGDIEVRAVKLNTSAQNK